MASSHSTPVTALQVGTYFVNQYYQVLQQQPECAYQFYTDISTMYRVDRDKKETASGMMEIHSRVMSLNYTGCLIELKSADAQYSFNEGVLVMVTGSIQRRDREVKRNFVQTFFLAPQQNGYYVLNDIFRFCEDDSYVDKQSDALTNGCHEPQLKSISPVTEPALEPSSPATIEIKREFSTATTVEEEAIVEEYNISDQQEFPILEDKLEDVSMEVSIVATSAAVPSMETVSVSASVEETAGEVPKHTYASILQASKAMNKASPSTTSQSYQTPSNKPIVVGSEQQPTVQPSQQNQSLNAPTEIDEAHPNASDDVAGLENGGDGRSIYIKNLPLTVAASDLEMEFKKFGKIKPGGVNVVNKKDTGVCYAFVDFEDSSSVQSAVGASPIQFGGRQIYIEEKRTSSSTRGRRGGRGRGFQNEGVRARGYYVTRALSYSLRCRSQSAVYDSNYKNSVVLQQSPWANMPAELLRDVLLRIEESEGVWPARKDVVACAGVCRSWRLIAKEIVKTPQLCGKLTFPLSLKQPGPRDSLIQCFIKRNRATCTYHLYLGLTPTLAESGKFLLAARKFRRAASADYVISLHAEDMSRGSNTYIGKLRSNFLGTKFTIYDSQPPHNGAIASTSRACRRVGSRQVSPKVPAGSYVVAHIAYELNVLGTRGPRRMQCTMDSIPTSAMEIGGSAPTPSECPLLSLDSLASFPHFGSKSGVIDSSSFSGPIINGSLKEGPLVLKNKSPRWHEQLQCWCLNFRGRVTVASVKNFQLVSAIEPTQSVSQSDHDKVILQFGKVGRDMFTMDYRYPLSAFQAFAICLSSFDTKLACE